MFRRLVLFLLAAAAAVAGLSGAAPAADLVAGGWRVAQANTGYADLPNLAPEIEFDPANDLTSLAFACDPERMFLLVVAPGFPAQPVMTARLGVGDASVDFALRDLYGAPAADAPKIDWDATILWGEMAAEDFSEIAPADAISLAVGERQWRIALRGFEKPAREFLSICAASDPG